MFVATVGASIAILVPKLTEKYINLLTKEKLSMVAMESISLSDRLRESIKQEDLEKRSKILDRFPWLEQKLQNLVFPKNIALYSMLLSVDGKIILHSKPYFEGCYQKDYAETGLEVYSKATIKELHIVNKNACDRIMEVSIPIYSGIKLSGNIRIGISSASIYQNNEPVISELRYSIIYLLFLLFLLLAISGCVIWYLFIQHIREEKEAAGKKRLETIWMIAGGLAHELRNPLNSMKFNIRLIRDRTIKHLGGNMHVEKDFFEMVQELDSEIDRLNGALKSFLSYAKPLDTNYESFDVNSVTKSILNFIEPKSTMKNIHFKVNFQKGMPLVNLPNNGFKQCVLNLLLNAEQASPEEGGEIVVSTYQKKSSICLEISDNGCGIPEEIGNKVFDLFFSRKEGGTGLGLPIVKQFADHVGGNITFRAKNGTGTIFTLELPINK